MPGNASATGPGSRLRSPGSGARKPGSMTFLLWKMGAAEGSGARVVLARAEVQGRWSGGRWRQTGGGRGWLGHSLPEAWWEPEGSGRARARFILCAFNRLIQFVKNKMVFSVVPLLQPRHPLSFVLACALGHRLVPGGPCTLSSGVSLPFPARGLLQSPLRTQEYLQGFPACP